MRSVATRCLGSGISGAGYFVSLAFAESFGNLDSHLVPAERRTQLYALHHGADVAGHLLRDANTFRAGFFSRVRLAHSFHELLGNRNAKLVHHKFSVAIAGKRPDAGDDRKLVLLDLLQEQFDEIQIEHRLRHDVFRAGLDLPSKTT